MTQQNGRTLDRNGYAWSKAKDNGCVSAIQRQDESFKKNAWWNEKTGAFEVNPNCSFIKLSEPTKVPMLELNDVKTDRGNTVTLKSYMVRPTKSKKNMVMTHIYYQRQDGSLKKSKNFFKTWDTKNGRQTFKFWVPTNQNQSQPSQQAQQQPAQPAATTGQPTNNASAPSSSAKPPWAQ